MARTQSRPLRAISIRQPYTELILRGQKKNEFRSRPTNIRERVYIYAALKPADDPRAWGKADATAEQLQTGAIVGTVEIAACHRDERTGGYAYRLLKPRRLKQPLYAKNQPTPCFWRPKF
jgi:hypothetical protein